MSKKKFLMFLIIFLVNFFLVSMARVKAMDIVINEMPAASSITYGQPLFSSTLSGGSSNVEGFFSWKNKDKVLDVGVYEEKVVFVSGGEELFEFDVRIEVLPRRVYLKFEKELRKQYNGNDRLEAPNYIVGGIIDSSVYVSGNINLTIESVFVGENINVTIDGIELKGERKENYYLDLSGFKASVHPKYIEKFGVDKNRVDFSSNTYVPANSVFQILEQTVGVELDNLTVKKIYDLNIVHDDRVVDVSEKVSVKLKIKEEDIGYKRIKLYNYYNGEYKELEYTYVDGFLTYSCIGLGKLVIATENYNFIWLYILGGVLFLCLCSCVIVFMIKKHNKINRYKSLKRRNDYGSY